MQTDKPNETGCGTGNGLLPGACAPLAFPYIPTQENNPPRYGREEALQTGTLFPGLNLPFKDAIISKTKMENTALAELMALDFVLDEMELYLDTHRKDAEAFATYQSMLKLAREGRERYTALYGPVTQTDLLGAKSYTWLNAPWPWDAGKED